MSCRRSGEFIIDFHTARLDQEKEGMETKLRLSNRITTCYFRYRITSLLREREIERKDEHENAMSQLDSCKELSFHGSPRCAKHVFGMAWKGRKEKMVVNMRLLQDTFNSMPHQKMVISTRLRDRASSKFGNFRRQASWIRSRR